MCKKKNIYRSYIYLLSLNCIINFECNDLCIKFMVNIVFFVFLYVLILISVYFIVNFFIFLCFDWLYIYFVQVFNNKGYFVYLLVLRWCVILEVEQKKCQDLKKVVVSMYVNRVLSYEVILLIECVLGKDV